MASEQRGCHAKLWRITRITVFKKFAVKQTVVPALVVLGGRHRKRTLLKECDKHRQN